MPAADLRAVDLFALTGRAGLRVQRPQLGIRLALRIVIHPCRPALPAKAATSLWRTARGADWRTAAGWTTLALLAATAWLLPWYVVWALPLAAVSADRRLRAVTLLFCAYAILIHLPLAEPLLSPQR